MQAKITKAHTSRTKRLLGALKSRLWGGPRKAKPAPRTGDIPDYLRADLGLPPPVSQGRQTGDPPTRDPFRLL